MNKMTKTNYNYLLLLQLVVVANGYSNTYNSFSNNAFVRDKVVRTRMSNIPPTVATAARTPLKFVEKSTELCASSPAAVTASDNINTKIDDYNEDDNKEKNSSNVQVSFSHVHLYADHLEDVSVYKQLEDRVTNLVQRQKQDDDDNDNDNHREDKRAAMDIQKSRKLWKSIVRNNDVDILNGDEDGGKDTSNNVEASRAVGRAKMCRVYERCSESISNELRCR